MKVQLLPSTFDPDGTISQRQHLSCIIIDDIVAFDAGSLAFSCSDAQRESVRDVVITHAHLDHIAGLPIFLDDLFATLTEPVRVHASAEIEAVLERDVFNWSVYPRFSELRNSFGRIIEYRTFVPRVPFSISHLTFLPFEVNHNVPSVGALVSDGRSSVGITGDTAATEEIWEAFRECRDLRAVLVECAFPDDLSELADVSHHLTPSRLALQLEKFGRTDVPAYAINIKPMHRDRVVLELSRLGIDYLNVLQVGRTYEF